MKTSYDKVAVVDELVMESFADMMDDFLTHCKNL